MLDDPKYDTLRSNSQALKAAEEKIEKLGGDYITIFIKIEEEALKEVLNSEAQEEK